MSRLIGIHTIQTTTTFLSGILNIARVKHCCKDVLLFLVSHPPKLYILYRYTDEYSIVGRRYHTKNLHRNLEALNLGGKFYISSDGVNAYILQYASGEPN